MKYSMRKIMSRAWEIKKLFANRAFAACLRQSWKEAKAEAQNAAYTGAAFINGMEITIDGYTTTLNRWTKNTGDRVLDRIYVNDGTKKGLGYIDLTDMTAHIRGGYAYHENLANAIMSMVF